MLKSSKILILFDLKIRNCYYKNAQEILGWSANGHHHWCSRLTDVFPPKTIHIYLYTFTIQSRVTENACFSVTAWM